MAPTAATDINTPVVNDPGEVWTDGDLPAQGGGMRETLMPGQSEFTIPANIAQLWDTIDIKDENPRSKTFGQIVRRNRLKFSKEAPLVVASGPHKGEPFTAQYTGHPRGRGRGTPEDANDRSPYVSDLAYLLEIGLGDKSRPTTAEALKARINQYAGKTVRIEHGLVGNCNPERVRYVLVEVGGQEQVVQDPKGTKGCYDKSKKRADGKGAQGKYYTKDFKDPETGEYTDSIQCDCGAVLRGFPQHERFLPPLGAK